MFNLANPILIPLFSGLFILSACTTLQQTKSFCPNTDLPCASKNAVAVLSSDSADLKVTAQGAAKDFAALFGKDVPPTIIVPGGQISVKQTAALKANGFKTVMPWLGEAERNKIKESSVRKQVLAQMQGLPKAVQEAAIQQALAQIDVKETSSSKNTEFGALTHELGHMWFIANYSKENETETGHAYGGWAPDWLDETAAVLMENVSLKDQRRSHFSKMEEKHYIPLSEFLEMEHPSAKAVKTLNLKKDGSAQKSGSNVRVLSGAEAEAFIKASGGDRVLDFYAQVLVFSDYLMERSGGIEVFHNIAETLANGKTIEEWLTSNSFELPVTLSDLQKDWTAWVLERP